ncbi:DUF2878 family protein [Chromobacterium haemolyticum]|uniref:DUF2878 family protein n=1 Tax=Chromobacterium haemolyticum TaxID=394935 RepID=A0ABS3GQC6_9NEIS|nr:DUF2878 family protein [Chromobacterium haemolyticum]MBK0415801.1 DUF2878 family protein [Chromobacterium haemolyticum]MBO0417250.1 DUF2878 family protein [Chromobacterium haemolyticum]MBO0500330.1 DUF2878 family protein [Chromobacterium haemolyticum]MDH0341510.1 DUF2878 domain-containing protein [Chromobacterium haemolyticum]
MTPEAGKRWPRLLLGGLLFCAGAWLLLSFRDRYVVLLLAGALLAWQGLPAGLKARALLLTATGCLLDFAIAGLGLYRFVGVGTLPLWRVTLWLSFSCWWLRLLDAWRPSPRLLALIGALAGPLAYWGGAQLRGLQAGAPLWLTLLVLAPLWAALLAWTPRLLPADERAATQA